MPLIPRLTSLRRNLLQRERVERELDEEIEACLEMLVQAKVAEGLSAEEARRSALIELGGVEQVKESVREVRVGHFFRTVWQDFRYGARSLRKSPRGGRAARGGVGREKGGGGGGGGECCSGPVGRRRRRAAPWGPRPPGFRRGPPPRTLR